MKPTLTGPTPLGEDNKLSPESREVILSDGGDGRATEATQVERITLTTNRTQAVDQAWGFQHPDSLQEEIFK